MDTKQELKERFERLYKGCTLFCIQLDGFTHRVFYKDPNGERQVERFSSCMSNEEANSYGMNKDRTRALFIGYSNYLYQNNAKELIYKSVNQF